jgi:hypothetical protein
MSLGVRDGVVVGVEGRVDALLEIARWMVDLADGDPSSLEGLFLHGIGVGMRLATMASPAECLSLERAAMLRRHGGSTSCGEITGMSEIAEGNAQRILSGAR